MKTQTENTYQEKVNQTIDYISSHLHEPVDLDSLAQKIPVQCISFPYLV